MEAPTEGPHPHGTARHGTALWPLLVAAPRPGPLRDTFTPLRKLCYYYTLPMAVMGSQ